MKKLDNLKGFLINSDTTQGDATHKGKLNINHETFYVYGWAEEKIMYDGFGKKEPTKYFVLWSTHEPKPAVKKEQIKTDELSLGFLFPSNERENYKHPHYKGEILIGGEKYYLGAWKQSRKELVAGDLVVANSFSLSVSTPQNQSSNSYNNSYNNSSNSSSSDNVSGAPEADNYDDIPF